MAEMRTKATEGVEYRPVWPELRVDGSHAEPIADCWPQQRPRRGPTSRACAIMPATAPASRGCSHPPERSSWRIVDGDLERGVAPVDAGDGGRSTSALAIESDLGKKHVEGPLDLAISPRPSHHWR